MRRVLLGAATGAALGVFATPVAAQSSPALFTLLPDLVGNTVILKDTGHQAHFKPGPTALEIPNEFNREIVTLLSTFPLGSSSGGFTYVFDPALGAFTRRSGGFGPAFAERAITVGRQKLNVGAYYQHSSYSRFEGRRLDSGDIKFYIQHQDVGVDGLLMPYREGDIIEASISLDLSTDTVALFANYGLTDRLDVGIAIPIVGVAMDAHMDAGIDRLSTGGGPDSGVHVFDNQDMDHEQFHSAGSAAGIGDVVLRAKYQLDPHEGGGLAAGLDVRLPTGDEQNLLGSGALQSKVFLISSTTRGIWEPHVNVGYTFSKSGLLFSVEDEFNYTLGVSVAATPRLTIDVDVIGRTLQDAGRLAIADRTFQYTRSDGGPVQTAVRQEFQVQSGAGALNLALGAFGVKYHLTGSLLVSANVLVSLNDAGLRTQLTPVVGLDWAVR